MKAWGWEIIVDLGNCDLALITDADNIKRFAIELVERIDMKAYGNPIVVNFGSEDKAGYTLVQLIETSNITAHFSNDTCSAFVNVFSCKPFDKDVVIQVLEAYFKPKVSRHVLIERIAIRGAEAPPNI